MAQNTFSPGDIPPLPDPVELEILEYDPFPGTTMVPGMHVVSSAGQVALRSEPSFDSDMCGYLEAGSSVCLLDVRMDANEEIWYLLRMAEIDYYSAWCPGNELVPDPGYMTEVPFLASLAAGLASSGQMAQAHSSIENVNGIGVLSEEDEEVLVLIYSSDNPPTNDWNELLDHQDCTCLFAGRSGFSYCNIVNLACMHEISPSGKYFAIGADGTGTWRGGVELVDLQTRMKYRYDIPQSGVGSCSDWIEGDFLLMESIVQNMSVSDPIEDQPWINKYYFTEARERLTNIVMMHGNRAWLILPEDRYYNYRLGNEYGLDEQGIFFDVEASPNIVPSIAGIQTEDDFSQWIDSMGGQGEAFPTFDFRFHVDTLNMSVSCLRLVRPDS